MKKFLRTMGILMLLGGVLTGCSMGPEAIKSETITDETKVQELYDVAKEAMVTYFDAEIEDGVERKVEAYENYVLVDLATQTYLHRNNMIQGKAEGDPVPGEIYSYGVSMDPETNAVTGAIIVEYSEAAPQQYDIETLEAIAVEFLTEKQIIKDKALLVFNGTEKSLSNKNYTALRFQYNGEDDVIVSINLQTGQVTHFEYSPKIELDKPSEK